MIRISAKIYVALLSLLMLLVGSSILVSCIEEDDGGIAPADDYVYVSIKISAENTDGISVTRADDDVVTDPNAESGELMNTLCVFIVDNTGTIEAKLQPDLDADNGNLKEWVSDKIPLTSGDKTIYAFANWDNAESTAWDALITTKTVGNSITADELAFTIDDPASKVDIEKLQYIPMSGKETVAVSVGQSISVGLKRLVGKVTIAVQGEEATDVTLGNLTFSTWADQVFLFSDIATEETITYNKRYALDFDETNPIIVGKGETKTVATFYVNETVGKEKGFDITLDAIRYSSDGSTNSTTYYTASTVTTDIPRNNILPITLTLDQYVFDLGVIAWTAPIGIEEVPYYNIEVDGNTWNITLYDITSTFELAPTLKYNGNNGNTVNDVTWIWGYDEGQGGLYTEGSNGSITVTQLTATPGYKYSFTLDVAWTPYGGTQHTRSYSINVGFVEGGYPSFSPDSRIWQSQLMGNELINMTTLGN